MNDYSLPSDKELKFDCYVVLVYGSLRTGGIETLIVRIANHFASIGVRVFVCCTTGGSLDSHISKCVNLIYFTDSKDLLGTLSDLLNRNPPPPRLHLISFDPISAGKALLVETRLKTSAKISHLSGVFHPRAYFMNGERRYRKTLNYLLAKAIGQNQIFFMNEECRNSHSCEWQMDLSQSRIMPLPITMPNINWTSSGNNILRIISVGRLVDFKAYNIGAPSIIKQSLSKGVNVNWDIFGTGPLQNMIVSEIMKHDVSPHLHLCGDLEYSQFKEVVSRYSLFIGMGTAALEAAALGVPVICAAVDEPFKCYGYIDSLPFGNVGEKLENPPNINIVDLIASYSEMSVEERRHLSNRCRRVAEQYDMNNFTENILKLAFGSGRKPNLLFRRLVAEFEYFVKDGLLSKIIRSVIVKFKTF